MAVTGAGRSAPPWFAPHWPGDLAPDRKLCAYYNPRADELVVRFAKAGERSVAVAINTPERDYAHLLVDAESGAVGGVQVDDLLAWAVREHPKWRLLAWPDVAERQGLLAPFLAEVATLFARFGTTLVPVPDDNPDLATAEIEQGLVAIHRDEDVFFRHVAGENETERVWAESRELDREFRDIWTRMEVGDLTPEASVEEALVLFDRFSQRAVEMSTRRSRMEATTRREQSGIAASPALARIQALLDEMSEALDAGSLPPSGGRDYGKRMSGLLAEFRREWEE